MALRQTTVLTFRLVKSEGSDVIRLMARDDESGVVVGNIPFETLQDAHDVANAVMDTALDPPTFAVWNVSLHG